VAIDTYEVSRVNTSFNVIDCDTFTAGILVDIISEGGQVWVGTGLRKDSQVSRSLDLSCENSVALVKLVETCRGSCFDGL